MADGARGRFLNRLFRRLRFSAEWQSDLFTAVYAGPDHWRGSRGAPPFAASSRLHHHTDFLLELFPLFAWAHGRAGHNKRQYKHGVDVFRDLRICSRIVPAAVVALETRSDFPWLAPAGWIRVGFGRGWNRGTRVCYQIPRYGGWSHSALDGWNPLAGV